MFTTIARHRTVKDFSIAILTRAGRPGFQVVRIDDRDGQFITLHTAADEAAARTRANAEWSADTMP